MPIQFEIEYFDGRTEEVDVGLRELADWERQPWGCSGREAMAHRPFLFSAFTSWRGLRFQQRTAKGFEEWLAGVRRIGDPNKPTHGGGVDPTNPDQPSTG